MTPEIVARLSTRREPRCEFLSVKYAVPAMRRAGGGSIIITSSTAGLRGSAGLAGYCATKGGVRLFAKAVAMECAAEADGIRGNTVHPGVIDTPIWTKLLGSAGRNMPLDPNEVAKAGTARQGRTGPRHRKRRALPRLGRVQLRARRNGLHTQPPQALANGASQGPEHSADEQNDASTYRRLVDIAPYREAV